MLINYDYKSRNLQLEFNIVVSVYFTCNKSAMEIYILIKQRRDSYQIDIKILIITILILFESVIIIKTNIYTWFKQIN